MLLWLESTYAYVNPWRSKIEPVEKINSKLLLMVAVCYITTLHCKGVECNDTLLLKSQVQTFHWKNRVEKVVQIHGRDNFLSRPSTLVAKLEIEFLPLSCSIKPLT